MSEYIKDISLAFRSVLRAGTAGQVCVAAVDRCYRTSFREIALACGDCHRHPFCRHSGITDPAVSSGDTENGCFVSLRNNMESCCGRIRRCAVSCRYASDIVHCTGDLDAVRRFDRGVSRRIPEKRCFICYSEECCGTARRHSLGRLRPVGPVCDRPACQQGRVDRWRSSIRRRRSDGLADIVPS